MAQQMKVYATGKRKTAVARVYIKTGTGRITINGREFEEYFPVLALRAVAVQPLVLTGKRQNIDVEVNIGGGGPMSQAESVKFGIAKALQIENPELRTPLKRAGFLTRDARIKERKKYGRPGARKRFQFSKR
jgi:small subunit ribosomal protein S9